MSLPGGGPATPEQQRLMRKIGFGLIAAPTWTFAAAACLKFRQPAACALCLGVVALCLLFSTEVVG